MRRTQIKVGFLAWIPTFLLPLFSLQNNNNMNKGTHFIGQPMYSQLIFLLDKAKILKFSRENAGERYVKQAGSYNVWDDDWSLTE